MILRSIARTGRFLFRRLIVSTVNITAAPPGAVTLQKARCLLMRLIGCKIGPDSQLSEHLYIYDGRNFIAGKHCRLGSFCKIWDFCEIKIGSDLLASQNLTMISGTHHLDQNRTSRPGPITIGDNVWIGINVTIVGPAEIGDNVIIGANSLVMGRLEANCVYAGSPSKLIRRLGSTEAQAQVLKELVEERIDTKIKT